MLGTSVLLEAAEASGEILLKFCQNLRSQGVNLAEAPRLQQILSQIQIEASNQPQQIPATDPAFVKHIESSPLFLAGSEHTKLIKCGLLQSGDPRIDQITNSQYFQKLQEALRYHCARTEFPVGTIIPDFWTDHNNWKVYSMPHIIVDYRKFQTVQYGERFGAVLLRRNAMPCTVVFSKTGRSVFTDSDLRKWLNVGGDYAKGCSNSLICATADVVVDDLSLRFFPPSAEEVHLNPNQRLDLENLVWEYFRDTPTEACEHCPKRIFLDPSGVAISCWLRSANRTYAFNVRCISSSGSLGNYSAYSISHVVPACVVIA